MAYRLFELGCLFFVYSFSGWILETSVLVIKKRKLINRGILTGPICAIYGVSAVVMTVGLAELRDNLIFLFLGCAVYATIIEWITGGLLEKVLHTKWWDYSEKKWNLGGYVCLQYSVCGGFSALWESVTLIPLSFLATVLSRILSGPFRCGSFWASLQ